MKELRRWKEEKNLGVKCKLLPNWVTRKGGRCWRWILCKMHGRAGNDGYPAKGGT